MSIDTIFALSSGSLPSGIAVIRVSGAQARAVCRSMLDIEAPDRSALLRPIKDPLDGSVIDHGVVLFFGSPNSFTGEDILELHLHGGKAVVAKCLDVLGGFPECRLAEAGEFSRRAFENGKLDLTAVEGLSDLIVAETEQQRKQAVALTGGMLRKRLDSWRDDLIRIRAFLEAEFDFADEEDVPGSVADRLIEEAVELSREIRSFLVKERGGEIIRDGFQVAIAGPPNAGKSSLLNALANREVAIVSEEAGTTRDVIEVKIDLGGVPVIFMDTAGIRTSNNKIEQEGMRRARERAAASQLVVWLSEDRTLPPPDWCFSDIVEVQSKIDLNRPRNGEIGISVFEEGGLDDLLRYLSMVLEREGTMGEASVVSRSRYREKLDNCVSHLDGFVEVFVVDRVLAAEELRLASDDLGRLTGRIDVEDLLGEIFSRFCIGK